MSTSQVERLLEFASKPPIILPGLAAGYLPSLGSVVAVTSNPVAVLTTVGVYESARFARTADHGKSGLRVYFNYDCLTEATVSFTNHAARLPPAIEFRDRQREVRHCTYLTSPLDELALECLLLSQQPPAQAAEGPRKPWSPSQDHPSLSGVPKGHPVEREIIPHLLSYLAALRLPVTMALNNSGCIHCDDGALDDISRQGDLFFVRSGNTTLSFDPALVGSWQVTCEKPGGEPLLLEAFSPDNRRQFYFTCAPRDCENVQSSWKTILESLL